MKTPKSLVSSSPGRPEKLPAPGFTRILLLRGRSKSRKTRARSGPILVSRSKSVSEGRGGAPKEEPTSPKVSCIGQVRIRNKNKNKNRSKIKKIKKSPSSSSLSLSSSSPALIALRCHCCCCCFCNICPRQQQQQKKTKTSSGGRSRPYRWFCWRRKKKKRATEDEDRSPRAEHVPPIAFVREMKFGSESSERGEGKSTDLDDDDEDEEEETKVFVTSSSTPPKNALLLMRCRSAPHNRSSALSTCRFVVEAVPASESEEIGGGEEVIVVEEEKEKGTETEKLPELQRAVSLMRCKSEPAKKGEKLMEVGSCGKWNGSGGGSDGSNEEEASTPPPSNLPR